MIASETFAKYDVPVPRYTSYPTVPHWHALPTTDDWIASLNRALAPPDASVSLYIHLPFCESLCTFCGCNTVITKDHSRSEPYIRLVLAELDEYLKRVPALAERPLVEIHLGGGTPTFSPPALLAELVDGLLERLPVRDGGLAGSVEADPRVTSPEHLDVLRARGFNRLSLGVQDLNDEVQHLVNRIQPPELTAKLVAAARAAGYDSVNLDLIYGLPAQTPASMAATSEQVVGLDPDRLAVYSFARVPWIKPQQRKFRDDQIPEGADKRALYEIVRTRLLGEGYIEIGLDHFARPGDGLARAAAGGTLHRNFQGYTERHTTVLLGLGESAISETPEVYHQNEKVITLYDRRMSKGELPTHRGHVLSEDDRHRHERILSVMTTFRADLTPEERDDAAAYLAPLIEDGFVELDAAALRVTDEGHAFLRNIAVCFDRYYRTEERKKPMYSRAL